MIPEIIHYCWISDDPYPDIVKRCIKSWKDFCPEYEIKLWGYKELMDIPNKPQWIDIALKHKKWAFIADYIRYYAVYHYGGFYADSDYILLRKIPDNVLNYEFVSSTEDATACYRGFHEINGYKFGIGINCAFFGGIKYNKVCKAVLDYYNSEYNSVFNIDRLHDLYNPIAPLILAKCCEQFGYKYLNTNYNIFNNIYLDKLLVLNIGYTYDTLPDIDKRKVVGIHICCGSWR